PAVFGSIWSGVNVTNPTVRNVAHEWHSLVDAPGLRAFRGAQPLWICDEPGITWQPFRPAPSVAASRLSRLVQMRSLVRRLTASIESEGEAELRLISQPLYRYPETSEEMRDGALFVFVMATDPEAVVLVETFEDQGKPA